MNTKLFRKTLIVAGVAAVLGISVSACSKSPDSSQPQVRSDSVGAAVSDTAITAQVKAKLLTESDLKASDISVTTVNGVVTLEGSVSDSNAKAMAERATRSIAGVTDVANNLNTATSRVAVASTQQAISDSWITTKVKSELLADSVSKGLDLTVETKQGVVALKGALKDQDAVDHVKDIAAGVEGVKSVDVSALTVDGRG